MQRIALTLIQGARGSGKSTLLDTLLARADALSVARLSVNRTADLGGQLAQLAGSPIDHVLIEVGGNMDADVLAHTVRALDRGRAAKGVVADRVRVFTVIDATRFLTDLTRNATSAHGGPLGSVPVAVVLAEQVEASDVLVVAKADLVCGEALRLVLAVLDELNPAATTVVARHGRAVGVDLLRYERPDLELARRSKARSDVFDHAAQERADIGLSSYVYCAWRPFHPERVQAYVLGRWPGMLRSRGIFWLATRMSVAGSWSQVGPLWHTSRGGFWWSALEEQGWPVPSSIERVVRGEWREPFGDRRQQLTLIGFRIDTRALQADFDACLLTAEELEAGPDAWGQWADPFPDWGPAAIEPEAAAGGALVPSA